MAGFKLPTFDERMAASKAAKLEALAKLRNAKAPAAPADKPVGPSAKEIAAAERRAAHRAAIEQEKAARAEARAEAERAAASPRPQATPAPTPEELKAARDARYAARKKRQKG